MTTQSRTASPARGIRLTPRQKALLSLLQDALLVVFFAAFAFYHVGWVIDGRYSSIPFAAENGLLLGIYLTRRRSKETSTRPLDWMAATVGGWLPLAMRVGDGPSAALQTVGVSVQLGGLCLAVVCFSWLGRSFGIVAANRGVKTEGPYRFVRHPIYAAHFVTMSGFVLANPSAWNVGLVLVVAVAQVLRIHGEERVLLTDPVYAAYTQRVRWRLVPGLF